MKYFETFEITKAHIKLLQRVNIQWQHCEFGAPEIDPKRPYGNSDVLSDIAEILGKGSIADLSKDELIGLKKIHLETLTALQIFLFTKKLQTGVFGRATEYDVPNKWVKLDKETLKIKKLLKIEINEKNRH